MAKGLLKYKDAFLYDNDLLKSDRDYLAQVLHDFSIQNYHEGVSYKYKISGARFTLGYNGYDKSDEGIVNINGDFKTSQGWSFWGGWEFDYTSFRMNYTYTVNPGVLYNNEFSFLADTYYAVEFQIVNISVSGELYCNIGGVDTAINSTGTKRLLVKTTSVSPLYFHCDSNLSNCVIDNIKVREIDTIDLVYDASNLNGNFIYPPYPLTSSTYHKALNDTYYFLSGNLRRRDETVVLEHITDSYPTLYHSLIITTGYLAGG